ncbi:MAG: hypothetical protein L6R40_004610 [Gallowayella cf. fulva]|nr:MAG: hypothetical protein L6R40_004610 [Xanthomendoza cf. fulva]
MASPQRKRSNPSLSTSATPSDTRAEKSAPYKHPSYMLVLEKEPGSYKDNFKLGIGEDSKTLRQSLLDTKEHIPENTIFRDDLFDDTCKRLEGKNEARIFKDCHPLMVPGVETHALLSTNPDLNVAVESVNEGWNNSIPVTKSSPQPDHAVGFGRAAFLDHQLQKLQPFLGDPYLSSSYFLGTYYMRFPFLTCKVKRGSAGLNIADRQNLHSMTLAVRGIVELFRLVNRAQELHRRSLAFSVSHDNENVRIHGHYPAFDRDKTTYWRHQILKYDFTGQEGLHKWTDQGLMVDDNPEPDASESTGFSEQLGDQDLVEVPESRSTHVDQQQITPTTSTHMDQPGSKRKMKGRS